MNKFSNEKNCLNLEETKAYVENSITGNERFEIENHLQGCSLCRDAVDGFKKNPSSLNTIPKLIFNKVKESVNS